jgi:hypothetical protein
LVKRTSGDALFHTLLHSNHKQLFLHIQNMATINEEEVIFAINSHGVTMEFDNALRRKLITLPSQNAEEDEKNEFNRYVYAYIYIYMYIYKYILCI